MSETLDSGSARFNGTDSRVNPHPAVMLYTRLRKSPYFWKSRAHGVAIYSVYNHTYHPAPLRRSGHRVLGAARRRHPVDVGVERQLEISGPDAFDFARHAVPARPDGVRGGRVQTTCSSPRPDGGIIDDPVVLVSRRIGSGCRSPTSTWSCGRRGWPMPAAGT